MGRCIWEQLLMTIFLNYLIYKLKDLICLKNVVVFLYVLIVTKTLQVLTSVIFNMKFGLD